MTQDEQEAQSFRYVAPRVFVLSSGNIAICPMVGRQPIRIVRMQDFDPAVDLPHMHDLENQHTRAMEDQRACATTMKPTRFQASLDDLA